MAPTKEPMRYMAGYAWCWFRPLRPDEVDRPSTLPADIFDVIQQAYRGVGGVLFYGSREAALKDYEAVVKAIPARDRYAGI